MTDELAICMTTSHSAILARALEGRRISEQEAYALSACESAAPVTTTEVTIRKARMTARSVVRSS